MQTQVKVALIAGTFVTIAAIINAILPKYIDQNYFDTVSKARRQAVNGLWIGTAYQEILPDKVLVKAKAEVTFSGTGKKVIAKGTYTFKWRGKPKVISFVADGGFRRNRFLTLEYSNANKAIIQFGNIILEMMPNGKELMGRFQGYGALSDDIVNGSIVLHKNP